MNTANLTGISSKLVDCHHTVSKMPAGHLPAHDGEPILANCVNCEHCIDQNDDPYRASWYRCEKKGREHMSNLRGFPFKTPRKCCKLHHAFTVDWDAESAKMNDYIDRKLSALRDEQEQGAKSYTYHVDDKTVDEGGKETYTTYLPHVPDQTISEGGAE